MGTVFHRQEQRHSENTTILKSMSALLTRQEQQHSENAQPFFNQWVHYQLDKNSNAVGVQPLSKNVCSFCKHSPLKQNQNKNKNQCPTANILTNYLTQMTFAM